MKSYELTYIITSAISSEEVTSRVKDIETFIQSKEGVILSSNHSTAQTLAYPIKKNSSGYFVTTVFQTDEKVIKEVKSKLDLEKEILRSVILVKRPVKVMKERRTRKPLMVAAKEGSAFAKASADKQEKLNPEDLDKKLDEILA